MAADSYLPEHRHKLAPPRQTGGRAIVGRDGALTRSTRTDPFTVSRQVGARIRDNRVVIASRGHELIATLAWRYLPNLQHELGRPLFSGIWHVVCKDTSVNYLLETTHDPTHARHGGGAWTFRVGLPRVTADWVWNEFH